MKKFLLTGLVVFLALAGSGAWLVTSKNSTKSSPATPAKDNKQIQSSKDPASSKSKNPVVTVYYDDYGFDPNIIQAPVNTEIIIKNISSEETIPIWIQPNPQSIHMKNKFNLAKTSYVSFTVRGTGNSGNWQFEANNEPESRGEINIGPLNVTPYEYPNPKVQAGKVQIVDDDYGFMPNEVKVPVGTTITMTNITTGTQPGATLYQQGAGMGSTNPALNIGILQKKQSKSFKLTSTGSWLLQNADQPPEKAFAKISAF